MVASQDDFSSVFGKLADPPVDGVSLKRKPEDQGTRENLRVYETMPAQLLNAYGMAAFPTMEKEKVWEDFAVQRRSAEASVSTAFFKSSWSI